MKKINLFFLCIFLILLFIVFRNWLFASEIIGGDWPYFYQENVNSFSLLPPLWNPLQGGGLGGFSLIYALDSYLYFTGTLFSHLLHIPWVIVYKIIWFGMFIFLSMFSMRRLLKEIFGTLSTNYLLLSIFIYITNTYILMVVGGGQMGVALGYAVLPLVLVQFIKIIHAFDDKKNFQSYFIKGLSAGLCLALQVMFDYRVAYIILVGVLLYFLFTIRLKKLASNKRELLLIFFFTFILPGVVTLLLHTFWLLPFLFAGKSSVSQLGGIYTKTEAVTFFSFAKLENTIALLHPYWPENIFGKIGFMKAEFLLLPGLAFSSLLFINNKKKKNGLQNIKQHAILFFALLGLFGAFLAKGSNEPFGGLYLWMFDHVPGFVMFRDPTKWYILVALSYSILLPFGILYIYQWLQSKKRFAIFHLSKIFLLAFIFLFLFLIRPALFGQLHGTFATHTVLSDYILLKNMLFNQHQFSRTLWLPRIQRYGFVDNEHPAIEGNSFFKASTSAEFIKLLHQKDTESKIKSLSVTYIIVPYDSEGEIFLQDRKYDESQMKKLVKELDKISWLQRDTRFKKLAVYTMRSFNDHYSLLGKGKLSYQKKSETEYVIHTTSPRTNVLLFSENYSPYWIAEINNQKIKSKPYNNLNSFQLPATNGKDVKAKIYFSLTKYYRIGFIVSFTTFFAIVVLMVILHKKKNNMEKNKHLLCIDFESWVVSTEINKRKLSNKKLRELDAGYTRKSLEFILKLLNKHDQKITFFLVFKLEELFPGLIKRILQDGHEIGWHSYSHPRIITKEILLDELEKSNKLLKKYHVVGFQAPEIIFLKAGYALLKKYGFVYSSSIYGNSNKHYRFDGISEIPVSVSNMQFSPKKERIIFPSSLTLQNILKFHIPYGSSYFWSILGESYYSSKLHNLNTKREIANLFIHNWQIIPPESAYYKKEYRKQLSFFSNPLFYPYNINVSKLFNYLISEFTFQRCSDYLYEKTK